MNTPVSFELAKLLKEKGFNEPCFILSSISHKDRRYQNHPYKYQLTFTESKSWIGICPEDMILIPNILDVVMWLYEKHGIWIRITPIPYSDNLTHWRWEHMSVNYATRNAGWKKQQDYLSPKEAYEVAIEYALNKLI